MDADMAQENSVGHRHQHHFRQQCRPTWALVVAQVPDVEMLQPLSTSPFLYSKLFVIVALETPMCHSVNLFAHRVLYAKIHGHESLFWLSFLVSETA